MIADLVWADGKIVRWDELRLSPATHSLSYASSVYEGIRSYGGAIFKCDDHLDRLRRSADVFGHDVPFSNADLTDACNALLRANGLSDGYLKPLVYFDDSDVSFKARGCSSRMVILASPPPPKCADGSMSLATAAWRRPPAACHPYQAKTSSTYALSYLSYRQRTEGFDDVLFLSTTDTVCESSGSNVFFIKGNSLVTPTTELALAGITRRVVIDELCARLNVSVTERDISSAEIESFDGAFLCGTAMEITEVSRIDDTRYEPSTVVAAFATEYRRITSGIAAGV
jgi:branched-chain amino acid aminotransferase